MKTILVIEDDRGINELISEKIEMTGYLLKSFFNGIDALEWLKKNSAFLIVLDYGLPDMNGNEFISKLKKISGKIAPFIVSTGQGDERIAVEMMKLGARDYVVKDMNFIDLLPSVVNRVVNEIENEEKLLLAEMELKENEANLKMLLVDSSSLININSENANYQKITDTIALISGAKYVSFDVINNFENKVQTYALSGVAENILKISAILGFEIINKKWNRDPKLAAQIESNIITRFVSLTEITSSQMPESISGLIEKTFNLGEIVVVKVAQKKEMIGFFTLFFLKGNTLKKTDLIEVYANQIGLYLERKKAEDALVKKMDELKFMNSMMVNRELRMVELKKEINELLIKAGQEKRYD